MKCQKVERLTAKLAVSHCCRAGENFGDFRNCFQEERISWLSFSRGSAQLGTGPLLQQASAAST